MLVDRLRVAHFRNLTFTDLFLGHGVNCFTGNNGAGKTSLLEAFHVVARARTFRSSRIDAVVQRGSQGCSIGVQGVDARGVAHSVVFRKSLAQELQYEVDSQSTRKLSLIAGLFPVQVITPDCADLVFLGPEERRRFMDWGVFHVKQSYSSMIRDFNSALRQRNAWLQKTTGASGFDKDPWVALLDSLAKQIDAERRDYCAKLFPIVLEFLARLNLRLDVSIEYFRGWSGVGQETLLAALEHSQQADLAERITRIGPHRADLRIKVDSRPANQTLSRGQAKLVAIAMKLAQASLLNLATSEKTTILFDELISELDSDHIDVVMDLIADLRCQVLLSAVELSEKIQTSRFRHAKMFHVEHGVIKETRE